MATIAVALATMAVTVVTVFTGPSATAATPDRFVRDFSTGKRDFAPMFRWWWPSTVDSGTAVQQLQQVADAGYKGVEITLVMDGVTYAVDPDKNQYGDANWQAAVKAVLAKGEQLGLQIDLTLGNRWPAAIPGLDISTDASSQELVNGSATVTGGSSYQAAVPEPPVRTYPDRTSENGVITTTTKTSPPRYVTATATKCVADCTEEKPKLDLNTVTDISGHVKDGKVSWTAPAGGTWMVTGYWQRGTAQRNDAPFANIVSLLSDPESRVVNHFDQTGTKRFLDYFNGLLDAEARKLLKANGGSIFEDSLELKGALLWSKGFFDAFKQVNGYDVAPYLPILALVESPQPFVASSPRYSFAEGQDEIAKRVHHDVEETLNDLYMRHHVQPIQKWANELGLTYRAQPYGEPIDLGGAAAKIDITECESLGCSETQFRTAAAGVALAGKPLLSSEMLPAGFHNFYRLTQPQIAALVNREFALGANHMVFHGLSYPTMPPSADGTIKDSSAYWPGFHSFAPRIGEAFGPRQPSWTMETELAAYYARMQQTLQTGRPAYDVAVLNQIIDSGQATHDATFLANAGYTFGYVTPGSLTGQPVRDKVLAPTGGGFKALVIDSSPTELKTAKEIARVAEAGLPLIIIGDGPQKALGYARTTAEAQKLDKAVGDEFAKIAKRSNVVRVSDDTGVLTELTKRGLRPHVEVADKGVKAIIRKDGGTTYHVLINRTDKPVTTSVALTNVSGTVPYALDPWTGKVTPVGTYDVADSRTSVTVSLPAGAAKIIALAGPSFTGTQIPDTHVVSTTAADAQCTDSKVEITATSNGRYTTKLSNGRTVVTDVSGIPSQQTLGNWTLTLDEWLPGGPDDPSSVSHHKTHTINNVPLKPWMEIPGIENAVGIGAYTTTFQAEGGRALLDLGSISGTYRVWVNGKQVPADKLGTVVDLGDLVKAGENTLRIEVASPLLNRVRVHRAAEFGTYAPTANGLFGPVTLIPYRVQSVTP